MLNKSYRRVNYGGGVHNRYAPTERIPEDRRTSRRLGLRLAPIPITPIRHTADSPGSTIGEIRNMSGAFASYQHILT